MILTLDSPACRVTRLLASQPAPRLCRRCLVVCAASASKSGEASRRELLASSLLIATSGSVALPSLAVARTAQDLVPLIQHDFQDSQYYITGRLTKELFASDCVFKDPTTNVKGPEKYSKAVAALFDPTTSRADLISIQAVGNDTIELKWRFEATLNVPTSPKIKPYTGTTIYHIKDGKVDQHIETWDISALDAFISVFIPSFGAPAARPL